MGRKLHHNFTKKLTEKIKNFLTKMMQLRKKKTLYISSEGGPMGLKNSLCSTEKTSKDDGISTVEHEKWLKLAVFNTWTLRNKTTQVVELLID